MRLWVSVAGAGGDVGDVAAGDVRNVAGTCHPCSDAGDEADALGKLQCGP